MITRYDFMTTQTQADGTVYPDCLSLPLKKFIRKDPLEQVIVKQENYYRPDLFFSELRGSNNMEDIILWLNNVSSRREMTPGTELNIPSASDLNSFYVRNRI